MCSASSVPSPCWQSRTEIQGHLNHNIALEYKKLGVSSEDCSERTIIIQINLKRGGNW